MSARTIVASVLALAAAAAAACRPAPPPEVKPKFSLPQLSARFSADLGAETVDVSAYPAKAQDGYAVFTEVCSQCHSPARALWAPEATREEWAMHIRRMHDKTLVNTWWTRFGKDDADLILDFLAHDSKVRKLEGKEEFALETARLAALLEEVKAERTRLQLEEGRQAARQAPDYMGDKPGGGTR